MNKLVFPAKSIDEASFARSHTLGHCAKRKTSGIRLKDVRLGRNQSFVSVNLFFRPTISPLPFGLAGQISAAIPARQYCPVQRTY